MQRSRRSRKAADRMRWRKPAVQENECRSRRDMRSRRQASPARGRRGAPQPIVDRDAETALGDRRDGDARRPAVVERAQIGKEMGGGLLEVAGGRKVEPRRRARARQRAAEIERRLVAGAIVARIEPEPGARRVVRRELAGRDRRAAGDASSIAKPNAASIRSRVSAPGLQQPRRSAEAGDDRRIRRRAAPGRRRGSNRCGRRDRRRHGRRSSD